MENLETKNEIYDKVINFVKLTNNIKLLKNIIIELLDNYSTEGYLDTYINYKKEINMEINI